MLYGNKISLIQDSHKCLQIGKYKMQTVQHSIKIVLDKIYLEVMAL